MHKTTTVSAREESKLKADAEAVLEKLGLTTSQGNNHLSKTNHAFQRYSV